MKKYLFIGGYANGWVLNIKENVDIFEIPCYKPTDLFDNKEDIIVEKHIYKKTPIKSNTKQYHVYVAKGLTADDMIERLLSGYNP